MDEHSRRNNIFEAAIEQGNDSAWEHSQQSEECPKATEEWRAGLDFGPFNSPMHGSGMATLPRKFFYTMWVNLYSPSNLAFPKMISNHSNLSKVSLHSTCT